MIVTNPRWAVGWLALAASVVVACNAISGLEGDYELGGTLPGDGGDESNGSSGSSGSSGLIDADVPDHASDAATDGGTLDCEHPPTGPNNGTQIFCDTFDDGSKTGPLWGWTRRQVSSGEPTVEAGGWAARGLHANVTTAGTPPGEGWVTALWKTVQNGLGDGQGVTMRFRFKVAAATLDYTVIAAIQLNGLEYGVALYENPTCPGSGVCIDENDHASGHDFANAVPLVLNQWYQADITVMRTGSAFGGKVVLGGAASPLDDSPTGVLPAGNPGAIEIGVGSFFSSNNGNANVVVDDVIVWRH